MYGPVSLLNLQTLFTNFNVMPCCTALILGFVKNFLSMIMLRYCNITLRRDIAREHFSRKFIDHFTAHCACNAIRTAATAQTRGPSTRTTNSARARKQSKHQGMSF
jgi:hypothetical protein